MGKSSSRNEKYISGTLFSIVRLVTWLCFIQAKFPIYEVIRVIESAVKSRVNSIPSHSHIPSATQLSEINALLSTETENKGKFLGSSAEPGTPASKAVQTAPL